MLNDELETFKKNMVNEFTNMQIKIANIQRVEVINESPSHSNVNKQKKTDAREEININADYLILGDSNTKFIKTNILQSEPSVVQKIFCATYGDVKNLVQSNKNISPSTSPKKILLHCGCNDLDKYDGDALQVIKSIEETYEALKSTFPNSKIIFSSLFPRGKSNFYESIKSINNIWQAYTAQQPFLWTTTTSTVQC